MTKRKTTSPRKKATARLRKLVPIPERGDALLDHVIKLTGIPSQIIRKELQSILEKKNIDLNQLTVEQLRAVVASYLREIMGSVLSRYAPKRNPQEQ